MVVWGKSKKIDGIVSILLSEVVKGIKKITEISFLFFALGTQRSYPYIRIQAEVLWRPDRGTWI